jgi:hypothetical protein
MCILVDIPEFQQVLKSVFATVGRDAREDLRKLAVKGVSVAAVRLILSQTLMRWAECVTCNREREREREMKTGYVTTHKTCG